MFRRIASISLLVITAVTGVGLIFSAWAGCIDPRTWPLAAVVAMTAPIFAFAMLVLLLVDLVWSKLAALVAVLCMVAGYPAYVDNFPFHPGPHKLTEDEKPRSWTLLTYNVHNYAPVDKVYPDSLNPMFSYIINSNADVVAIEEAEYHCAWDHHCITQGQIDSVAALYPHIMRDAEGITLLSKFPVRVHHDTVTENADSTVSCATYSLDIHGERVSLFVVHLQSIGLTADDKQKFREMTSIRGKERPSVGEVRSQLVGKLSAAAAKRADQADALVHDIKVYGGTNAVLCGDFNDVPGCWALRRLQECGMREVYPEVGMGYMSTYNRNRFWFRIDHVLYRGNLRPVSMERGKTASSDHYPLLTTFVFD